MAGHSCQGTRVSVVKLLAKTYKYDGIYSENNGIARVWTYP